LLSDPEGIWSGLPPIQRQAAEVRALQSQYQMESARVWEHQALTRARFSAGDREVGRQFEAIRAEVLSRRRDRAELAREVLAMRQRMREAHANKSELFDLKHDAGGLIDVEFIVQYLVLGHAHEHPQLLGNLGNIALLRIAGEIGLIPAKLAARVGDAYREYRHLQHGLRLNQAPQARSNDRRWRNWWPTWSDYGTALSETPPDPQRAGPRTQRPPQGEALRRFE
jgi:glutamine synthetase adenylyltransferase